MRYVAYQIIIAATYLALFLATDFAPFLFVAGLACGAAFVIFLLMRADA